MCATVHLCTVSKQCFRLFCHSNCARAKGLCVTRVSNYAGGLNGTSATRMRNMVNIQSLLWLRMPLVQHDHCRALRPAAHNTVLMLILVDLAHEVRREVAAMEEHP